MEAKIAQPYMMAGQLDIIKDAFDSAKESFRSRLKDKKQYDKLLSTTTTINDIGDLIGGLQEDAAAKGGMRYMAKLKPFVEHLQAYAITIDTFVQAKPELLAFIWGPIRFIIQTAHQYYKVLDDITDAFARITRVLPHFNAMARIFHDHDAVKAVHVLFFQDILDFYAAVFNYFSMSNLRTLFESIWSKQGDEIERIVGSLEQHSDLMREEVTFLDIQRAQEARDRALTHYSKTYKFQEAQKFQGLKTRMNPTLYDQRLDWLRERSHSDGAKWLLHDKNFNDWLDVSNGDSTWLWLRGKPGAGKTFLAAAAIDRAKEKHMTLFIFANQMDQGDIKAQSVIQSLIFQAAMDNASLQPMLLGTNERDLHSSTSHVSNLLKSLLISAGPTYIIIDGLDEIEEGERQILLEKLEDIVKACNELKLLICSQSTHDIKNALSEKAKCLFVDENNWGSIQRYINTRVQKWMSNCDFDLTAKRAIHNLLLPLSAHAEGMFLYARIFLDNLERLHGIDDIREELKVFPTDLNQAYHRIVRRINELGPYQRERCRKILTWICYAPSLLTTFELEQAILVDETKKRAPGGGTPLNFVRECGPIIEVIDGLPQFVHFTAKSYIFSSEIDGSIHPSEARLYMASTSLSYLCSGALDPELPDTDIEENLTSGKYRLLEYLAINWFKIAFPLAQDARNTRSFAEALTRLDMNARNHDFLDTNSSRHYFQNASLARHSPQGYKLFCSAFQFHRNELFLFTYNLSNNGNWVDKDPLNTSKMLVRVRQCLDALVCRRKKHDVDCNKDCVALQRHYGRRLYKCTYLFCPYSRLGFESISDRDNHIKYHGNPYKCFDGRCIHSATGFETEKKRDKHWLEFHQKQNNTDTSRLDGLDGDEIQPLLFRHVRDGDVNGLRDLLACSGGASLEPDTLTAARDMAAGNGFLLMVQILDLTHEKHVQARVVTAAVKGGKADVVQWALSRSDPDHVSKLAKTMLQASLDSIYSTWEQHLLSIPRFKQTQKGAEDRFAALFGTRLIKQVDKDNTQETRLVHTWDLLVANNRVEKNVLSATLIRVAQSTCSIPLARCLIKAGADLTYPTGPLCDQRIHGNTALYHAAQKTTKQAAYFMKFLLESGAHPFEFPRRSVISKIDIGDQVGAKRIAHQLDVNWETIVDKNSWRRTYKNPRQMAAARIKMQEERKKQQKGEKQREAAERQRAFLKKSLDRAKRQQDPLKKRKYDTKGHSGRVEKRSYDIKHPGARPPTYTSNPLAIRRHR